jgi:hypothetical protein
MLKKNIRILVLIVVMSGLLVSGCLSTGSQQSTIKSLPPKPVLENSWIDEEGTLHIPKGDKEELMLYIRQLENICSGY